MKIEMLIKNHDKIYNATNLLQGEIIIEKSILGSCGKLVCSIIRDGNVQFVEGNQIQFFADNKLFFSGWIMKKTRTSKQIITVTAYDQFFYLIKNKDTYVYYNKKASELIQMIANDYGLEIGAICDTAWQIPQRIEEGQTLWDMINTALHLTQKETAKEYFFYDECGKLTLKQKSDMVQNVVLQCDGSIQDYVYTTDISEDTYNGVQLFQAGRLETEKLSYRDEKQEEIKKWGRLLYYQRVDHRLTQYDLKAIGDTILSQKCRVKKNLILKQISGEVMLIPGNSIFIELPELAEISLKGMYVIEKCVYHFFNGGYQSDFYIRMEESN